MHFFSSTSDNTLPSPEAPVGPIPCSSFSATQVSLGPARGGRKLANKTPNLTSTAPNVKPHTAQGCHFTPQLNWQPLFEEALHLLPSSFPPPVLTAPPVSMKGFGDLHKQQKINFWMNLFSISSPWDQNSSRASIMEEPPTTKDMETSDDNHLLKTSWAAVLSHMVQLWYFTKLTAGNQRKSSHW